MKATLDVYICKLPFLVDHIRKRLRFWWTFEHTVRCRRVGLNTDH